ncbi:GTPase IMAP family member 4-like [Mytilus trossulus]|uniref:GTPase IMAP family member 4-like n=1 Tax=Mytilus trossulus TaxID=6551 RepID=UPI003004CFBB
MSDYPEPKDLKILITGKTGSGKTSVANNLLKERVFKACCQATSVTKECQRKSKMMQDTWLTVVDTPGFFDTNNDIDIDAAMAKCIELSIPGPHVILNVVCIGRFTEEDYDAITFFTNKFGNNVNKHCLLVLTRFDDYKRDNITTNFDFESFISGLPHKFQSLLRKTFEDRYIPFDNTLSGSSSDDQVAQLMQKVDNIIANNNGKCYTNEEFKKAEIAMKKQIEDERKKKECEKDEEIKRMCSIEIENIRKGIQQEQDKMLKQIDMKHQQELRKQREQNEKEIKNLTEKIELIKNETQNEVERSKTSSSNSEIFNGIVTMAKFANNAYSVYETFRNNSKRTFNEHHPSSDSPKSAQIDLKSENLPSATSSIEAGSSLRPSLNFELANRGFFPQWTIKLDKEQHYNI